MLQEIVQQGKIVMTDVAEFQLFSRRELIDRIERMNVSADTKALLAQLATTTVDVAGRIIEVGRRILSFVIDLAKRFPNAAFGLTVGFVVSSLIASVPIVGAILGPLLAPLLISFGLAVGALGDLKEAGMRSRMAAFEEQLGTLTRG
jgi:hypothetical protein